MSTHEIKMATLVVTVAQLCVSIGTIANLLSSILTCPNNNTLFFFCVENVAVNSKYRIVRIVSPRCIIRPPPYSELMYGDRPWAYNTYYTVVVIQDCLFIEDECVQ